MPVRHSALRHARGRNSPNRLNEDQAAVADIHVRLHEEDRLRNLMIKADRGRFHPDGSAPAAAEGPALSMPRHSRPAD